MSILLPLIALLIAGAHMMMHQPPVEAPKNQFELPQAMVGGAPITEPVEIKPLSEFKFANVARQTYDYSCGSAALTTVLNFFLGQPVTEQAAMEGMLKKGEKDKIVARRGFSLLDMKRYVASLGFDSAGFRAEMSDLTELKQPAIVPIEYGGFKHFVVLRGIRGGHVYVADPSIGNTTFTVEKFASIWDRNTLFIIYPAKNSDTPNRLALSDRELGTMDMDQVNANALLAPHDNSRALEQAVQTGFGNTYFRHQ